MAGSQSLKKGVIANFLNPSPYLFWFSVGSPQLLRAVETGPMTAIMFMVVFYAMLVGSKLCVALVTAGSRRFLKSGGYIYAIRILGVVLIVFAGIFVKTGLDKFGIP